MSFIIVTSPESTPEKEEKEYFNLDCNVCFHTSTAFSMTIPGSYLVT